MIPSSSPPFADLTMPCGPPNSWAAVWAGAACESKRKEASSAVSEMTPQKARPMQANMISSVSTHPIARIERGCIGIPAALLPQVAHKVVQIRIVQCVLIRRHAGAAVANFFLYRVVIHTLAG